MKSKHEIDMSEGALFPKLVSFAVPVMLSGILQLAFNAADLIVVGRFAGETALAAVGSNTALINLIINVLLGMGTGTSVLVSRYYGAKNKDGLQDTVQTTELIAVIGGILFGIAGIVFSDPLLVAMGTPENVLPLARLYLRIYFCGLPVIITYNFSSAVLRAVGDTRRPLLFLSIAGVLNVCMNLIFVIVFGLGVAGVALATVLSQCVSCVLTVLCLIRSDGICRLDLSRLRFSKHSFTEIVRIGLPAGIQGSLFSLSNVIIQSSINSFGAMVMAGNSAAASVESFLFTSMDAINQSAVASVSQNMGARKYDRVKRAVRLTLLMQFTLSTALSIITMIFRRQLVGIYTSEAEAIEAGCTRIIILGVIYFTNGTQHQFAGIMRGHGYSLLPTLVTLAGICGLRIVWIYTVFAVHRTLFILYLSYPISWVITTAAEAILYLCLRSRAYARSEQRFADA